MPLKLSPLTAPEGSQTPTAGTTARFIIPNDFPVAGIVIRISGTWNVGVANAQALNNFGAVNVVSNVRIQSKGEPRMDISGKQLYIDSFLMNQGIVPLTQPALTTGNNAFSVTLTRWFQMKRMIFPTADRGTLPNHITKDVQLLVTIGQPTDVGVAGGGGGTLAFGTITVDVTYIQVVDNNPLLSELDAYLIEQLANYGPDTVTIAAQAKPTTDLLLNASGYYRYIALLVEDLSGTGGAVKGRDDLVGTVRLFSGRSDEWRALWPNMQGDNSQSYLVSGTVTTASANAANWPAGLMVLDWTRTFAPRELLDANAFTQGGAQMRLNMDVIATGTSARLTMLTSRIFGNLG